MRLPFVWILLSFSMGILAGTFLIVPSFTLWISLAAGILSLRTRSYYLALSSQLLLIALLGSHITLCHSQRYENGIRAFVRKHESETFLILGTVESTPEIRQDYFVVRVRISSIAGYPLCGVARFTVSGIPRTYPVIDDRIEVYSRVRLASNFNTEGVFDYERYLRKEGIHILCTVKNPALWKVVGQQKSIRSGISRLRLRLIQDIRNTFPSNSAGLLRALWLDDRGGLTREMERNMIDAGVFHVVAISGFHIALLLGLFFLLLKYFLKYRTALIALAGVLLFYFVLLEGRASVTRAFLMFLLVAVPALLFNRIPLANLISLSALLQLIRNPLEVFDTGFHLTYAATGVVLFVVLPLCRGIRYPRRYYCWIGNFLISIVCVQLFLTPYQAWGFHRIPVASLMAGIVAIPVSSILIVFGVLWLPFAPIRFCLNGVTNILVQFLLDSSALFADLCRPLFAGRVDLLVLATIPLLILMLFRRVRLLAAGAVIAIVLLKVVWVSEAQNGEFFQAHFIDVGQGDAILLQYPDGSFDLVDGGGFSNAEALDVGEAVLIPYFCRVGVSKLNRVFLTHAHADHMNGLVGMMQYVPVNRLYVTREPRGDVGYQGFLTQIPLRPRRISAGMEFQSAGVRLRILYPEYERTRRVTNEDSLVLLVEYAGKRLLLTGDSEANTERHFCDSEDLRLDFLKVAHHGSKTSSSECFLEHTRPRFAFISAGRNNWFGHPHAEVLARYRRIHATVYRTDRSGTIRLAWGAAGEEIHTFSGVP